LANLDLKEGKTFGFGFSNVTSYFPLLPGKSVSETQNLVGPQAGISDISYTLEIKVWLQNGATLDYTRQIQFK
jgi:hypothetical protein